MHLHGLWVKSSLCMWFLQLQQSHCRVDSINPGPPWVLERLWPQEFSRVRMGQVCRCGQKSCLLTHLWSMVRAPPFFHLHNWWLPHKDQPGSKLRSWGGISSYPNVWEVQCSMIIFEFLSTYLSQLFDLSILIFGLQKQLSFCAWKSCDDFQT